MATKKRRVDRTELDGKGAVAEIDGAAADANGRVDAEIVTARPERRGAKPKVQAQAQFVLPPLDPDLYINRELSWLNLTGGCSTGRVTPTLPCLSGRSSPRSFARTWTSSS